MNTNNNYFDLLAFRLIWVYVVDLLRKHAVVFLVACPGCELVSGGVWPEHDVRDVPLAVVVDGIQVWAVKRLPLSPEPFASSVGLLECDDVINIARPF